MFKSVGKFSAENESVHRYNGELKTENLLKRSDGEL
jgi:hypothetical protein